MSLLAVERIKLFSTRSPWWCTLLALGMSIGFTALITANVDSVEFIDVASTQFGHQFGLPVVMVLATLAITTEYRFGTIKITFQAVPKRTSALLAKAVVVAIVGGLIGLFAAFGSWAIALLIKPNADLAIDHAAEWRNVVGIGLVFAIASIIAVAVGTMIRHTAGAISLLLTYSLAAENLVQLIPSVGDDIHEWLPFNVANQFLTGDPAPSGRPFGEGPPVSDSTLDPWWALAYFGGVAAVLMIIALIVARKRDA